MKTPDSNYTILQLHVALTTRDYERLVKFYCAGLGIEPPAIWKDDGGQALMEWRAYFSYRSMRYWHNPAQPVHNTPLPPLFEKVSKNIYTWTNAR